MNVTKCERLSRIFYERDPLVVSMDLVGKLMVRKTEEGEIVGKIVETEAYIGPHDKASHAYDNRKTRRTIVQFGERGVAYVFTVYGNYHCFCVVVGPKYVPAVTLVRAVEPIKGIELMRRNRGLGENAQVNKVTNGPSRTCKAFNITSKHNGSNLLDGNFFLCEGKQVFEIGQSPRIGIDYAEEYKDVPWRFFEKGSEFLSIAASKHHQKAI